MQLLVYGLKLRKPLKGFTMELGWQDYHPQCIQKVPSGILTLSPF